MPGGGLLAWWFLIPRFRGVSYQSAPARPLAILTASQRSRVIGKRESKGRQTGNSNQPHSRNPMRPIRPHPPPHHRAIKPRQPALPRPIRSFPQPSDFLLRRLARRRRGGLVRGERGWAGVVGGWVEGLCGVGRGGGEARGVGWGACHCCGLCVVVGCVGWGGEPEPP